MVQQDIEILISKDNAHHNIEHLAEIKNDFFFFLANTPDYVYFKDKQHRFTYTSNTVAQLAGHDSWEALVGKTDFDIFPIEHAEAYYEKEKAVIEQGKELLAVEEPYFNLEGKLCWVSSSKRPIFDDDGNIVGLFGVSRDITKIKELEQSLSERAHIDSLTKVTSRLAFLEQAESLVNLAKRNNQEIALFYIDLDNFKNINDQYGHQAGDTVLSTVAKRFSERLRGSDVIGRMGGDEFVVIGFTDSQEQALTKLSSQLIELAETPIPYNGQELTVSCSIGIASAPKDGHTVLTLIEKADKAMYIAKNSHEANTLVYQG